MGSASNNRPPVGNFCESTNGNVYFARGDRPIKRWDGLLSGFVSAGVPAPSEAVYLEEVEPTDESGEPLTSDLSGTYYAYLRFLDSRGNVSNISPIGNRLSLLGTLYANIDNVSYDYSRYAVYGSPRHVMVTSFSHGLVNGDIIVVYGMIATARGAFVNGIYKVLVKSPDTFYPFYLDQPESAQYLYRPEWTGAYNGGAVWRKTGTGIQYSNVSVPDDDRVMKRQILRNKDGNVNTFYVDIEHTRDEWEQHVREGRFGGPDLAIDPYGTFYQSVTPDASLGEEVPLRALDGTDLNIARHSEPPDFKQSIVSHYNRIFAAVNLRYTRGSASVITASSTVTGSGTSWTTSMVGRTFTALSGSSGKVYGITAVDEDAQEITLDSNFEGTTDPTQQYSVSPADTEKRSIHFSESLLPESWDRNKVVRLTDDPQSGDMTALFAMGPRLFVGFEHRIYSINYMTDPSRDGQVSLSVARGCANQRCVVQDGTRAFILDDRGIYAFDGNQIQDVSQPVQAFFSDEYTYGIDWSMAEHFHASHSPSEKIIRWFVSMGSYQYPRHALVFSYRTNRWWIEEYPEPISSSSTGDIGSKPVSLWGGSSARVFTSSQRPSDGLRSDIAPVRGQVTEATSVRLTDAGEVFSDLLVGSSLQISQGKGEGQTRVIVGVGDHYLEVDRPFAVNPDSTSYYQVGGFRWTYSTPMMDLVSPPGEKALRSIETRFQPTKDQSTLLFKKYTDFGTSPDTLEYLRSSDEGDGASTEEGGDSTILDTTFGTGSIQQVFDSAETPRSNTSKSVRFKFEGVPNSEAHQVYSLTVEGVAGQ